MICFPKFQLILVKSCSGMTNLLHQNNKVAFTNNKYFLHWYDHGRPAYQSHWGAKIWRRQNILSPCWSETKGFDSGCFRLFFTLSEDWGKWTSLTPQDEKIQNNCISLTAKQGSVSKTRCKSVLFAVEDSILNTKETIECIVWLKDSLLKATKTTKLWKFWAGCLRQRA